MKIGSAALLLLISCSSVWSFHVPTTTTTRPASTTNLYAATLDKTSHPTKIEQGPYKGSKLEDAFPGALSNIGMEDTVLDILTTKGFTPDNTLLATSLCCDELARQLEDDFNKIFGNNFNLGGLAGFPFAGNTGFGAMAAHIPDDGYCLIVYGPHVGITKDGEVGKVERQGIKLVDSCCGSAIAASNYLKGITDGGATPSINIQTFTDFQQGAVQELILPHGKRLKDAGDNRMTELPYALFTSQDMLMKQIVAAGAKGMKAKNGIALLGGVQINTGPDTYDYFVPLRFELVNDKGDTVEDLLPQLSPKTTGTAAAKASSQPAPVVAAAAPVATEEKKTDPEKKSKLERFLNFSFSSKKE